MNKRILIKNNKLINHNPHHTNLMIQSIKHQNINKLPIITSNNQLNNFNKLMIKIQTQT